MKRIQSNVYSRQKVVFNLRSFLDTCGVKLQSALCWVCLYVPNHISYSFNNIELTDTIHMTVHARDREDPALKMLVSTRAGKRTKGSICCRSTYWSLSLIAEETREICFTE